MTLSKRSYHDPDCLTLPPVDTSFLKHETDIELDIIDLKWKHA